MKFLLLINTKISIKKFHTLCLSDVFIMLINVKMIVGILTFMSIVNFVLSLVDYEKSFITSGPAISNIGFVKQFNSTVQAPYEEGRGRVLDW